MKSEFLRVVSFLLIGTLFFQLLQYIFIPDVLAIGKLTGLYQEKTNTIDVIIEGTSHSEEGIIPMELYEKYGIKSYNLSTSAQPIEGTYYTLREALKTQKPQIFILDVSNLYLIESSETNSNWRRILNNMHMGENKLAFAKEYNSKFGKESVDGSGSIYGLLFPLLDYHTRWKDLTRQNFKYFSRIKYDYRKGGKIASTISGNGISVESMNITADELLQNVESVKYTYERGIYEEEREEDILYSVEIPEENITWFLKIKELCDENNIQMLAIKVPSIRYPHEYRSAWTEEKYNKVRTFCNEQEILYYDLLYNTNIDINWDKDSYDGGCHLNLYGAQKVTEALGDYLKDHYELSDMHDEEWDRDLFSYQKVRKTVELQLEQDFSTYIEMLIKEYGDKMILIAASDDMTEGLTAADVDMLRELGIQTNFSGGFRDSYIAVIDNGEVVYESLSNRSLNYRGMCSESGKTYELYSSGSWTNSTASIKVGSVEFAVNRRGMNIVVYDDERDLVLDSVCFDTYEETHTVARNNDKISGLRQDFERYIIEIEDR